jgi:hypothetical protein
VTSSAALGIRTVAVSATTTLSFSYGDGMSDRRAWLFVSLAIVAIAVLVVWARLYHWNPGDLGAWVSGAGAFAAACVALAIAVDDNRKLRLEQAAKLAESQARAVRRVKRIALEQGCSEQLTPQRHPTTRCTFTVTNRGSSPIYELTWYPPVVVFHLSPPARTLIFRDTTATITETRKAVLDVETRPLVLDPGHSYSMTADILHHADGGVLHPVFKVYPMASFEDGDGNRFGWMLSGGTGQPAASERNLRGWWALVGGEYPQSAPGQLGELLEQVEGW